MDFIIGFFRDTLDGGLYYVVVVICLILIMAIIGFIMEKAKIAKEESEKTVVIADSNGAPVTNKEVVTNTNANAATNITGSVVISDDASVNRPTEESNFIDFGSTADTTVSNVSTSVEQISKEVIDVSASQNIPVTSQVEQIVQPVENAIPQIVASESLESVPVDNASQPVINTVSTDAAVVPEIIDIN
ncbi:MAG: hypothetical protein HFG48_01785 [Bacilli bacterium]|nr:hypothetical protein [Bacilli bacterium]